MMKQTNHITIQDVANAAGVSTGTVSRVLNNRAGVKAKTRETVLETIQELNYQPDKAARELSFRQPTRIGLNTHGVRRLTPFYMLFLEHLVKELGADGYRLEEIPSGKDGLPNQLADAMILFGAHDDDPRVNYLNEKKVPFVLLGHQENVRWVAPNDFEGGYKATQHLLRLGHTDILHVTGPLQGQGELDRYAGYKEALAQEKLELKRSFLLNGRYTTLGAYRAVRKVVEAELEFTAIFAASDEMAVGAIAALEDCGLKVPFDVSVVGFDDLPEVGEHLTTIRQDLSQIAASTVALLKEGLSKQAINHFVIPVELIVRGTTARRR